MAHIQYSDNLDDFPDDFDDGIPLVDDDEEDVPGELDEEPGHGVPVIDRNTAEQGLHTTMQQIMSSPAWETRPSLWVTPTSISLSRNRSGARSIEFIPMS